ncbi:TetR/AcrR family transcriptional regulator [Gordonia sp. NPDC003376]
MARRRTDRGPLTRTEIIDAGLTLTESDGIDKLSLAKVAAAVGVQTMSLYNHIDNKADLLDGMAERLLNSVEIPPATDSWQDDMIALGHAFRVAAIRYPQTAPLVLTRHLNFPSIIPLVEAALEAARRAGIPESERVRVLRMFIAYLIGALIREIGLGGSVASTANASLFDDDRFPNVRMLAADLATCDHLDEFDRGLRLQISAIAATYAVDGSQVTDSR